MDEGTAGGRGSAKVSAMRRKDERRKDDIRTELEQLEWSLHFYIHNKLKTEEVDCRKRIKELKRMLGEE